MNKPSILLLSASLCFAAVRADERPKPSLRSPELAAQPHVATTPEQRKRVIQVTRALETTPFGDTATADRNWALSLIDHAPEIFPRLQGQIIGEITENRVPERRPIYAQFIFGFISFQLEQPDRIDDAVAAYHAGVASCLRVYRIALRRDAANRIPFLDRLDEEERSGTLPDHIKHLVATLLPEALAK
jgi:hypothetical protein